MKAGFTLIELLVVISIFIVITSVAVFSNNQFNSSILLTNLGYEIALSIREAQVYGITVKSPAACTPGSPSCIFSSGYGVHFSMSLPEQYSLFEDKGPSPNHIDDAGEDIQVFAIGRGYSIKKLCVYSGSTYHSVTTLDVSFVRPEPEAWISSNVDPAEAAEADIYIQDPLDSSTREVIVAPTGQISVEDDTSHMCS